MSDVSLNVSDHLNSLSNSNKTPNVETTGKNDSTQMEDLEFLEMLTTQLKYQDPLNPADNQAFAEQMATLSMMQSNNDQLAALEEIKKGFEAMSMSLYSSSAAMTNSATVNLINKEVKIATDSFHITDSVEKGEDVEIDVEIFENNANAEMVIKDSFGKEVYRAKVSQLLDETSEGEHQYKWNRVGNDGKEVFDGEYFVNFEVGGENYSKMAMIKQDKVTGVKFEGDISYVTMNDEKYPVARVLEIF